MDQPGKVANPTRGQLNRENEYIPLSPCVPENLVSRDGFSRPVPRQPAHLHTQAQSGAYLRDSVTPAGTSKELDVQNEMEENTHTQSMGSPFGVQIQVSCAALKLHACMLIYID